LVVTRPDKDRRVLLEVYHNSQMAGHLSIAKTLQALRKDY